MFVLHAEEGPDGAAEDLGAGDGEGEDGGVLEFAGDEGVGDPVEAQQGVDDHGEVVVEGVFVAEHVAQEGVFGVGIDEGPVHC